MNKSLTLLILFTLFLALFSGCEKEVKVSGIIVEPKNVCLSKGDVVQLTCLVKPYSADNKSVRWTSNDDAIATVSQTGLVTAITEGKTQIVATTKDGNFSDTVSVIVARGSPAGDSIALVKLYKIAINLPDWNFTKSMDTWEGVELNEGRRVIKIFFGNYIYVSKPFDSSIGDLACLKTLTLSAYYATKSVIISPEIGMLSELQTLIFDGGFTGEIPPELGNLSKLEILQIEDNQLTGVIPKELGNLTSLKRLYLPNNQLTGKIPTELGNLVKLQTLILRNNQLTGEIPQTLENIKELGYLDLQYNSLSGHIPQFLLNRFEKWYFCPQNGTNFDNLDCNSW